MKVVVVTTSYPRHPGDVAGVFVQRTVDAVRARGVTVEVVSPSDVRHYGIAYGDGIVNNLRRRPWLVLAVPLFLVSLARAARRAARDADVVHAHWLPSGLAALATRTPVVLQPWGSDVALAARARRLWRPVVRRCRVAVCASSDLAAHAAALGAGDVRVIPSAVPLPAAVAPPAEPPHVLFVGRLSEEKGVRDLATAAAGLDLVVVGDGPLRDLFPHGVGAVAPDDVGGYYERAAVVVVPSRREGYGVAAREAMAHGRPVVATAVGGLPDAVVDGETGLLVPAGDAGALRAALERLLGDAELRARLGAAARVAAGRFSPEAEAAALVGLYREVASGLPGRSR